MKITCKLTSDSPEQTFEIDISSVFYPVAVNLNNKKALEAELKHIITYLTQISSHHSSNVYCISNIAKENHSSSKASHFVAWIANDGTSNCKCEIPTATQYEPFSIKFEPNSHDFRAGNAFFDYLASGEGARFKKEARELATRLVTQTLATHARPQATDLIYDPKRYEYDIEKAKSRLLLTEKHFLQFDQITRDQNLKIKQLENEISKLESEIDALRDNETLNTQHATVFSKYVDQKLFELTHLITTAKSLIDRERKHLALYSEVEFDQHIHECYQHFATFKNLIAFINALLAFHIYEGAKKYWNLCLEEAEKTYVRTVTNFYQNDETIAQDKKTFLDKKQASFNSKFKAVGIHVSDHILQDNLNIRQIFYNSLLDHSRDLINSLLLDCANEKRALKCVKDALLEFDKDCRADPIANFKKHPEYEKFVAESFVAQPISHKNFRWQQNLYDLVDLLNEQTKKNYPTEKPEVRIETSVADSVCQDFIKKLINEKSRKNFKECESKLKEARDCLNKIESGSTVKLADSSCFQEPKASIKEQVSRFKDFLKQKSKEEAEIIKDAIDYDSSRSRSTTPEIEVKPEITVVVQQTSPKENPYQLAIQKILVIISDAEYWNRKLHGGGTSKTKNGLTITHNNQPIKVQNTIAAFIQVFDEGHSSLHDNKCPYEKLYNQLKLTAIKTLSTKKWYHGTLFDPRDKVSYSFYETLRDASIENIIDKLDGWMLKSEFPKSNALKMKA